MNTRATLLSLIFVIAALVIPAQIFAAATSSSEDESTTKPTKVTIVLAGDSTVTDGAGWARGFDSCLTDEVHVINLSRGGRSSKSFIAEGLWAKCLALKPDYVLIQFGHNDQPGHGPDRETDPSTTYRQYMTQYVDDARAHNITPVLVSPLSRRQWGTDGKIHSTLAPYAQAVRDIAAAKNVPLIDLQARSIELYERLGKDTMLKLSPRKNADPKNKNADTASAANNGYDGTHLNAKGSQVVGAIVAQELAKAVPALAPYIKIPPPNPADITAADLQ